MQTRTKGAKCIFQQDIVRKRENYEVDIIKKCQQEKPKLGPLFTP